MTSLNKIFICAKKELGDYFSSPAALLFLGLFAGISLFSFFWLEAFYSRNIADVRPLFSWMPLLLIFLIGTLTMRSWAEERRNGTIEVILTAPVSPLIQILGKFFAVLSLVLIALALTFSLVFTVNALGDLDWGPVIGGYIAAIFLAAAYTAIGLWASARTDNQIVSLILTVLIAGLLYAIGSQTLTGFFDYKTAEVLRSLGTGSRFESITRGVLDFRDILYYLSITIVFLFLNRLSLEKLRWAGNQSKPSHHNWYKRAVKIFVVLLILNIAFSFSTKARLDLTDGQIYSLSNASKQYLNNLDEPLLIRGYFSANTHPLLAPLIPRIRDLLLEYEVAGGNQLRVEFVDPHKQAKFEEEARTKFAIRPVSFQTASKYQAAVVNTYFHILVKYQDQYDVLGYKDLVELKSSAAGFEVELNSPEYIISRTIRNVAEKVQREDPALDKLISSYAITGYISNEQSLTDEFKHAKELLDEVIQELSSLSNGNIDAIYINPDEDQLTAEYLSEELGLKPYLAESPNSPHYWFYVTISDGKQSVPIILPNSFTKTTIRDAVLAGIKRLLPDTSRTVALLTPSTAPAPAGISASIFVPKQFNILRNALRENVKVVDLKLENGKVPAEIDFLMIFSPRYLDPTFQFAIEEFLVRGGSILIATAPVDASVNDMADVQEVQSGLENWLKSYGIQFHKELVLDTQHGLLPVPSPRRVGSLMVHENKIIDYPFMIDVRDEGLNQENVITSRLGQIYMPWSAHIEVDADQNPTRTITTLLKSSQESWTSKKLNVLPDFENYPDLGFPIDTSNQKARNLAIAIEGDFKREANNIDKDTPSRLILVSSNALFTDNFSDLMTQALQTEYRRPAQFAQNMIDWALEDEGMLNVLSKHSHFSRTLKTLDNDAKKLWEYFNYGFVVFGLVVIYLIRKLYIKRKEKHFKLLLRNASV